MTGLNLCNLGVNNMREISTVKRWLSRDGPYWKDGKVSIRHI